MPKVKRITNLSREARRRVTTDQVLPSPSTRKSNTTKQDVNVVVDATTAAIRSTDIDKDKTKTNNSDETNVNVKKNTTTSTTAAKNKNEDDNDNDEPGTKASQPSLSRGQRKRQAKHEKFLKKEKMILSSLMLKKQDEQKKRIDGLDAIKQALRFCEKLMAEGKEVYLVDMQDKDPSEMGFENFTKLIQTTLPLTYYDLMEQKLAI